MNLFNIKDGHNWLRRLQEDVFLFNKGLIVYKKNISKHIYYLQCRI